MIIKTIIKCQTFLFPEALKLRATPGMQFWLIARLPLGKKESVRGAGRCAPLSLLDKRNATVNYSHPR